VEKEVMNPNERERLVDAVLDRALGPQRVEPRAGLEQRILANLPKEVERRRWWRWMWVPAVAAAAVLAVVIGMSIYKPAEPVVSNPGTGGTIAAVPTTPHETTRRVQPPRVVAKHVVPVGRVAGRNAELTRATPAQALPRQAVFPAPVPLTDQERLLLALVNRHRPEAELVAKEQQVQAEKVQKYFETGEAPVGQPTPAQMR
jgi:hypothetical protein